LLPEMDALLALQRQDSLLMDARRKRDDIPRRKESLRLAVNQAKAELEQAKKDLEQARIARRAAEKDVEGLTADSVKLERQLHDVKTNKEYQAILHEIEGIKSKNGLALSRIGGFIPSTSNYDVQIAQLQVLADNLAQVVDRVQIDVFQFLDRGIDVARHGEVDQHERRGAAAPDVTRAEDRARGARRADHEVSPRQRVVKTIRRDRVAAALRGEALRAGGVAAEHEQLAHAVP